MCTEVVGTGHSSAAPKPAGATPEAACACACAVCMQVVVDLADEAFQSPRKQVGPHYSQQEARRLADAKGWTVAPDGDSYRRVVASPLPLDIVEAGPINTLLQVNVRVYCCRCVVAWEVTAWEVRCTNHALPAHCPSWDGLSHAAHFSSAPLAHRAAGWRHHRVLWRRRHPRVCRQCQRGEAGCGGGGGQGRG
jgi:hypothetical protein